MRNRSVLILLVIASIFVIYVAIGCGGGAGSGAGSNGAGSNNGGSNQPDKYPWISISPDSGDTTGEVDSITVTIDRTGLSPGINEGYITVTPQYYGRPQQVKITATVSDSAEAADPGSRFSGRTLSNTSSTSAEGDDSLQLDQVRQDTRISWEQIISRKVPSGEGKNICVIQHLGSPYPDSPGVTMRKGNTISSNAIDAREAEERAISFISQNSMLFIGKKDERSGSSFYVKDRIINQNRGEHAKRGKDYTIVLGQLRDGMKVFESEARISMTQYGEVWSVDSSFSPLGDKLEKPLISSAEALEICRKNSENSGLIPEEEAEMYVYPSSRLAWQFNFHSPLHKQILIDATTGESLLMRDNHVHESSPGHIESLSGIQKDEGPSIKSGYGREIDRREDVANDGSYIRLSILDADFSGLSQTTGECIGDFNISPYQTGVTDLNGFINFTGVPTGSNYLLRAKISNDAVEVRDEDSGGGIVQKDTPYFLVLPGSRENRNIELSGAADGINSANTAEAGLAFRESMRGWNHMKNNFAFERSKASVYVDATLPQNFVGWCSGDKIYFLRGYAAMDDGVPDPGRNIDDFIMHEYAHSIYYESYGDLWGRPAGCKCKNHGSITNDCSYDAILEGWADYFPVMLYNSINPGDTSFSWSNSPYALNLEHNTAAYKKSEERDEFALAGVLFDIYDSNNDDGDTLSLGEDEIWTVFRSDNPKTVEEFFQKFINRYPSYAQQLEEIFLAHGMSPDWLTLSSTSLDFGQDASAMTFTISNLNWYAGHDPAANTTIVQPTWRITKSE